MSKPFVLSLTLQYTLSLMTVTNEIVKHDMNLKRGNKVSSFLGHLYFGHMTKMRIIKEMIIELDIFFKGFEDISINLNNFKHFSSLRL